MEIEARTWSSWGMQTTQTRKSPMTCGVVLAPSPPAERGKMGVLLQEKLINIYNCWSGVIELDSDPRTD
jgi:hypothetical protein